MEQTTIDPTLDGLYEMIDGLGTAMLTTRRKDGHLVSRAMATQKRAAGAHLWFVAAEGSAKLAQIEGDPHVNLAFFKDRTREWVSVAGLAKTSRDRAIIAQLYAPDWKIWFAEEGDPRHGTAEDPRMVLIGIEIHAAVYLQADHSQPVVLFEIVKGFLTGEEPDLGTMHEVKTGAVGTA